MREWRIDIQRFLRDPSLFIKRSGSNRAHIVQTVGKLDDQHAQVASHGYKHLSHRRRLLGLSRIKLQPLQLRQSINNAGDFGSEIALDIRQRDFGIFDSIVQECSNQRHLVQANFRDNSCHGQRMTDIQLATHTGLMLMRGTSHRVGSINLRDRGFRMVLFKCAQ